MPSYKYTGDDVRVYPHVALTVAPGDIVECDDNPDPQRFTTVKPSKSTVTPEEG